MNRALIDLYSDYLITAFSQASATSLSRALDGQISHDTITRFLADHTLTGRDYWQLVKPFIREVQGPNAVIAIDDFIVEKPSSDENSLIAYHYDHTLGRSVKGMNIVDAVYVSGEARLPLDFAPVTKGEPEFDFEHNRWRRSNVRTKNELYRDLLRQAVANGVPFSLVLNDVWYASSENMIFVKRELGKDFVMPVKSNRRAKLVAEGKTEGKTEGKGPYQPVSSLDLKEGTVYPARLEGVPFVVFLTRAVFRNEDGSEGVLYLVTSLTGLSGEQVVAAYQTRWRIEEQHKSAQQNAAIGSSPAWLVPARRNHVFCAFVGVLKLERMRLVTGLNHFALRGKLYLAALKAAMGELQQLRAENVVGQVKPA